MVLTSIELVASSKSLAMLISVLEFWTLSPKTTFPHKDVDMGWKIKRQVKYRFDEIAIRYKTSTLLQAQIAVASKAPTAM